jgi:cysteine desulfurase
MPRETIYLDSPNATRLRPEVREAMLPFLDGLPPNANAAHRAGRRARKVLKESREKFASWLGVDAGEIIFTSGGTESNVLGILGFARAYPEKQKIISTVAEHPSVHAALRQLAASGYKIDLLPVNEQGFVDPNRLKWILDDETALVALHLGNHDIGTIQPVREVAELARERGIPVFVDATFSAGWVEVRPGDLGIDILSMAPYRFFGPQGVGVLWIRSGCSLAPLLSGGSQEFGLRSGSQNVAAIAGAGEAARLAHLESGDWRSHTRRLSAGLLEQLGDQIDGLHCFGPEPGETRMPHHLSLAFDRVEGEALMLNLDVGGVCVTAGAGCLPANEKISPVLKAMGVGLPQALGMLVFGPGPETSENQISEAVARFSKGVARLRSMSPEG